MTTKKARLIAVDGLSGIAVMAAARAALGEFPRSHRPGVSTWDASGLFGELAVGDEAAGAPSARTLLLLYAADLAFRLRWQIRPAMAEGRTVVAAPYVATAIAFGRAAGLHRRWLTDLLAFAPRPSEARLAGTAATEPLEARKGFFEFGCERLVAARLGLSRRELIDRALVHLPRLTSGGGRRAPRS